MNTFFRHKKIYKFTWEARGFKSITDYIIINKKLTTAMTGRRAFNKSETAAYHDLL
jgi:hypothetical protein